MKKICTHLGILVIVAFILLPVSVGSQNITNSSIVPATTVTGAEPQVTTPLPAETTVTLPVGNTTTMSLTNITAGTTTETVPVTTATITPAAMTAKITTTPVPATYPVTQVSSSNITAASSPPGASLLIDGVYYGTTPGNFTGIPAGNHIVRLTLSGYYDYEGTIYIIPGQVTHVFGTLPPLSGAVPPISPQVTAAPVITAVPSATMQPAQTASGGIFDSPAVIAAVIGIITASIGAGATIFTHMSKTKKE